MATSAGDRAHLFFALGDQICAVPLEQVREIIAGVALTRLPGAPPWVRGVFNLRGAVVPLVDLAVKLGLDSSPATTRTSWVVVELLIAGQRQLLAFAADDVREIAALDTVELHATPPVGLRLRREVVSGVVPAGEGFASLLDLVRLLGPDEHAAASAAAKP